jgi:hypothetical protein
VIALPYRRHFKLHIEVDLRVITTYDNQEEGKNLKFCLDFTRRITSQEKEVDSDQVEVNITWYLERRYKMTKINEGMCHIWNFVYMFVKSSCYLFPFLFDLFMYLN